MKIELLHTESCHIWQKALEVLEEMLKEMKIYEKVKVTIVKNDKEAAKYKFAGSPQIKINGKDIDPMASRIRTYTANSCRQYFYEGKIYEYPPKEMILKALRNGI